jgi:hypothetical protein
MECFDVNLNPVFNKLNEIKTERSAKDSDVYNDDCVELFLSPEPAKGYYHIAVNGKGAVYDAQCRSTNDKNISWNGDISVKTSANEKSWIVELAIPFASINTGKPQPKTAWRANFCREQKGFKEDSSWAYTPGGFHNPERFGTLRFDSDAPALRSPSEILFKLGENTLALKAYARKAAKVVVATSVAYENADTVTSRQTFDIAPGENPLPVKYSISPDLGERKNSESLSLSYQVFDGANSALLFASPAFVHKTVTSKPFFSSFKYVYGDAIYYDRKELHICQNTVQLLMPIVQTARKDIANCRFILEVPAFVTLVNPISKEKTVGQPTSVDTQRVKREGIHYTGYTLDLGKDNFYPMGDLPKGKLHATILLEVKSAKHIPRSSMVYFHTEGESGNETLREPENRISLTVLPPLVRKTPKHIPIANYNANKNLLVQLAPEEREKMIMNWVLAGFNMEGIHEFLNITYSPDGIKRFRAVGMEPIHGLPLNQKNSWAIMQFPDAPEYLKEFPQYRAKTKNGKSSDVVICRTQVLDANGTYRPRLQQWLGQLAKEYSLFLFDYEVTPDIPTSVCYCDRCLKAFQEYARSADPISVDALSGALANKWVDFQCYRTAGLAGVLREIIKTTNSDAKLFVYSGYQSEHTRSRYGVDWTYLAPNIDAAICGYGRQVANIEATHAALKGKPLVGGELVWTWEGTEYPMAEITINLFRRITDCGGGILSYNDFTGDGRYLYAINRIASIVADYEDFFLGFSRNDTLAGAAGIPPEDIAVLVNKAGARLVFCFNPGETTRELVLINQHLTSGMTASSIETKERFSDPSEMKVSVPSKDVRTFYIGVKK